MSRLIFCLLVFLFPFLPSALSAQTIIDLKPGGGVRAKTIDDYKEELRMKEKEEADSVQYADNLLRAFNALHTDSLNEAERLFNESLKLRPHAPGNHVVLYNLALIDLARGQHARAIQKLTNLIKEMPNYHLARLTRAEACLQLDRTREAVTDAETLLGNEALRLTSDDLLERARFVRAAARYRQHRYSEARTDLLLLLKENPRHLGAAVLDALALGKTGQPKEAVNRLNLILAAHPQSTEALTARAGLYTEEQLYALARADYDRLIELSPEESSYYIDRARILINLNEKTAARRDLDKAIALGTPRGVVQSLYNLTRNK